MQRRSNATVFAEPTTRLALACIDREYPNKPEHVLDGAPDARPPRDFHRSFFGYEGEHWLASFAVYLLTDAVGLPAEATPHSGKAR